MGKKKRILTAETTAYPIFDYDLDYNDSDIEDLEKNKVSLPGSIAVYNPIHKGEIIELVLIDENQKERLYEFKVKKVIHEFDENHPTLPTTWLEVSLIKRKVLS